MLTLFTYLYPFSLFSGFSVTLYHSYIKKKFIVIYLYHRFKLVARDNYNFFNTSNSYHCLFTFEKVKCFHLFSSRSKKGVDLSNKCLLKIHYFLLSSLINLHLNKVIQILKRLKKGISIILVSLWYQGLYP